ncbi:MAG: hypothetical protein HXY40_12200 [Chloroflexi bacterium]|nr:hypothetical protein [Chloroflexota bacterium]
MSDEQQPIWQQALKDSSHPLHQATWLIFAEKMSVKGAAKLLAGQREQVIQYCMQILEADELLDSSAFGKGMAPVHAVDLLGKWRVEAAVPKLLQIVEREEAEESWDTYIYSSAIRALERMPPSSLETFWNLRGEAAKYGHITLASILARVGKGEAKVYEWLLEIFEKQRDEMDIEIFGGYLLENNREIAIPYLENWMQSHSKLMTKRLRKILPEMLEDARSGKFPYNED